MDGWTHGQGQIKLHLNKIFDNFTRLIVWIRFIKSDSFVKLVSIYFRNVSKSKEHQKIEKWTSVKTFQN